MQRAQMPGRHADQQLLGTDADEHRTLACPECRLGEHLDPRDPGAGGTAELRSSHPKTNTAASTAASASVTCRSPPAPATGAWLTSSGAAKGFT